MLEHKIDKNKFVDFCNGDVKGEDTETLNHFGAYSQQRCKHQYYCAVDCILQYCSHRILSLLIIQSIISYKNQKHFNQFTMSLLFCVILFCRFFLPLYLPLSEFVNTDGTI